MPTLLTRLRSIGACEDSQDEYAMSRATPQAAWSACRRGDWLLWCLGKAYGALPPESQERRTLTLAMVECAALALRHTTDPRVEACLITTWRWGAGDPDVTLEDVRAKRADAAYDAAAYAAAAAYDAAAYAAAADAAYAAASDA